MDWEGCVNPKLNIMLLFYFSHEVKRAIRGKKSGAFVFKRGRYDFPRTHKILLIESKYVFFGPVKPSDTSMEGMEFSCDDDVAAMNKKLKRK